jgi:hypothetical protein
MSDGAALVLKEHIEAAKPQAYSLPWEKVDGAEHMVKLLFRWTDDKHIRARSYATNGQKPLAAVCRSEPGKTASRLQPGQAVSSRPRANHADSVAARPLRQSPVRANANRQGPGKVGG